MMRRLFMFVPMLALLAACGGTTASTPAPLAPTAAAPTAAAAAPTAVAAAPTTATEDAPEPRLIFFDAFG